jgi:hypothetical protein
MKLKYRKYEFVSNVLEQNMLWLKQRVIFADIPVKNQISASY